MSRRQPKLSTTEHTLNVDADNHLIIIVVVAILFDTVCVLPCASPVIVPIGNKTVSMRRSGREAT